MRTWSPQFRVVDVVSQGICVIKTVSSFFASLDSSQNLHNKVSKKF